MATEITIRGRKQAKKPVDDVKGRPNKLSSAAIQKFIREKSDEIQADFPDVQFVRVVVDQEGPQFLCDVGAQGGRKMNATASSKDPDKALAVTAAFEKIRVQLRKLQTKRNSVR